MESRKELILEILDRERAMFLDVSAREPVSCQQDPEGFRLNRGAQFSVWSEDALVSYREDLRRAATQGKNLMTLKYARMERLIQGLHDDILVQDLIDRIVAIQVEWQKEMMVKYPCLMRRGRPLDEGEAENGTTSFVNYLRSELETYSGETLTLLHRDVTESRKRGRNMTEAIYLHMVRGLGYGSIEEAETAARQR